MQTGEERLAQAIVERAILDVLGAKVEGVEDRDGAESWFAEGGSPEVLAMGGWSKKALQDLGAWLVEHRDALRLGIRQLQLKRTEKIMLYVQSVMYVWRMTQTIQKGEEHGTVA